MRVLVLGYGHPRLLAALRERGCLVALRAEPVDPAYFAAHPADFLVSHRYRHILKPDVLALFFGRAVNLHISLLPYNRGADPNLWSFLENTPKGVTVHHIDQGLDTGDIVAQKELVFDDPSLTLRETYDRLDEAAVDLFIACWPGLAAGVAPRRGQPPGGTLHRLADKTPYLPLLTTSWDTPVSELAGRALKKKDAP